MTYERNRERERDRIMKTLDTTYVMNEDGSATWFSPEASQDAAAARGKDDAAEVETRKVVRAEDGHVLKLGDKVLGTQTWLKDGQIPEGLEEVKEEETEPDLMNEVTAI